MIHLKILYRLSMIILALLCIVCHYMDVAIYTVLLLIAVELAWIEQHLSIVRNEQKLSEDENVVRKTS